jgi:hypothetical protein
MRPDLRPLAEGKSVEEQEQSRFPYSLAAGVFVVLLLVGGVFVITRFSRPAHPASEQRLPFGAEEQAYAGHIHLLNLKLSQATNFLNQEFTYVNGEIANDGARAIRALEITLEFHDPFGQLILRENQRVVAPNATPLLGGQHREFQVTLEHIPVEWNHQFPNIRVTGLVLE